MASLPFSGRSIVYSTIFLLLIISSSSGFAEDLFTINTADQPPYSTQDNNGINDRIIIETFRVIGKKLKINHMPSARSLENVNNGIDDGEYARIAGLTAINPNLRIVDEKLLDYTFTAFTRNPDLQIHDWNDLTGHNVAFINGWKIYETEVKNTASVFKVHSEKELFALLSSGRIDIALYERRRGLLYIKSHKLDGIYPLASPLAVKGMYLYFNSRHEAIIPAVEQALRSFKQTSNYQLLINNF